MVRRRTHLYGENQEELRANSATQTRTSEAPAQTNTSQPNIVQLQRTLGNQGVQRLLETGGVHIQRDFFGLGALFERGVEAATDLYHAVAAEYEKMQNSENPPSQKPNTGGSTDIPKTPTSDTPKKAPKPIKGDIPDTPLPAMENQAVKDIDAKLKTLEATSVEVEDTHNEETGDSREELVTEIADIRKLIDALDATQLGVDETTLSTAKANFFQRLQRLVPYYGQMANINLLTKGGTPGWDRTCNTTVPAMCLEGLGLTAEDFIGNTDLVEQILNVFEPKPKKGTDYLNTKRKERVTSLDGMRLADFTQLAVVYTYLLGGISEDGEIANAGQADATLALATSDPDGFADKVTKARTKAASVNTSHAVIKFLPKLFGAQVETKYGKYHDKLEDIGSLNRYGQKGGDIAKARKYLEDHAKEDDPVRKTGDYKFVARMVKLHDDLGGMASEDWDDNLSVDSYRKSALPAMRTLIDSGAQVIVGMENHFVRLQAVSEDAVIVDDPGSGTKKNLKTDWREARDKGYFKMYWVVTA